MLSVSISVFWISNSHVIVAFLSVISNLDWLYPLPGGESSKYFFLITVQIEKDFVPALTVRTSDNLQYVLFTITIVK